MQKIEKKHKLQESYTRYHQSLQNSPVKRQTLNSVKIEDDTLARDDTTPVDRAKKSRELKGASRHVIEASEKPL